MKVGLLAYNLTSKHSGQTRFLVNLSKGIKSAGHYPVIFSLFCDSSISSILNQYAMRVHSLGLVGGKLLSIKSLTYRTDLAVKLAKLVRDNDTCDVYVVLADEAIPVVKYLEGMKTIYITNGDLSLLFLNNEFRGHNKLVIPFLERDFVSQIRKHSKLVSMFDRVIANSQFTSNLMAFLYGIPISDVVYPPVDQNFFIPKHKIEDAQPYALAMVRHEMDPLYKTVSLIAKRVPVKVVGGANVEGAQNMGFVTDDELQQLYSGAYVTLSPNTMEFYGYTIVESMSCSTPSLAYNNAGARELVKDGLTGWLAKTQRDLVQQAINLFVDGYDNEIRNNCIADSIRFGIPKSTESLLSAIRDL